jgi:hypothetical protein
MSAFSSVMVALAGPIAKKVLAALGIGFLTYAGVDTAVQAALGAAKSNFAGTPADIASILALAGVFTSMSIIAGGISAGLSMMVFTKLAKIA